MTSAFWRVGRRLLILAVQLGPAALLVVMGWGFRDLSDFFATVPRVGLALLALLACFVAAIGGLDFYPLRKGETPVGAQRLQLGVLVFMSAFLLWFLPFACRRGMLSVRGSYWPWIGLAMCCAGVAVRLLALHSLGEFFSAYVTLQTGHRLVRNGIYGRIRHPLYLSLLLIPAGIALVFASVLVLPILVLSIIFVVDRIRREDQLLHARFGLEFEDYRRRTRCLVPF